MPKLMDVLTTVVLPDLKQLGLNFDQAILISEEKGAEDRAWLVLQDTGARMFLVRITDDDGIKKTHMILTGFLANKDVDGAKKFLNKVMTATYEVLDRQHSEAETH